MVLTTPPAVAQIASPRYALLGLAAGYALLTGAMAAASTAGTLVAADHLGAAWGGVPSTAGIVGTGAGAIVLSGVMQRRGRRAGLALGYGAGAVGGVVALTAAVAGDVLGLSAGMLLLGMGNASGLLSRYAAAELYPVQRRGFAIGAVVGAGAIGAVGGPLLLEPLGALATALGWPATAGPFLLGSLAAAAAAATAIVASTRPAATATRVPVRLLLQAPQPRVAVATMVTAQLVMVAVMTAAPLDMHQRGAGLASIGAVVSAHTLGMFALSPLTGRLIDRTGTRPVMAAGLGTLTAATVLVAAAPASGPTRTLALFGLGYAWNLCFIGGSSHLTRGVPPEQQPRVEGAVDGAVWLLAAGASLASTALLTAGGYTLLAGAATGLVLLPVALLRKTPLISAHRGGEH